MQYNFTVFVGDPHRLPTIVGSSEFRGISLIDTDVYIPNGGGEQWVCELWYQPFYSLGADEEM